jgi:hypothetical protein
MVAELKSVPFYKPNVLAMLNTLFPPTIGELPNDRIRAKDLNQYRSSFYRYITAVEAKGPEVMKAFEYKMQMDDNRHNWKSTWSNLQHYIELAEIMIKQADVAIELGIDMFVEGNYTYSSPLSRMERGTSTFGSSSLNRTITETSAASSVEGPAPRSKALLRGLSFGSLPFRSHSRSRANTNNTTSTTSFPSLSRSKSSDTASTLEPPPPIRADSFETTRASSFSSTVSTARQTIYANTYNNTSASTIKSAPSLPRLDTNSIRGRQRAVSKPVMPFDNPGSVAAQHEAFSSNIILPNTRNELKNELKSRRGRVDLIDRPRPSTSHGEKSSKGKESPETGEKVSEKALKGPLRSKLSIPQFRRPSSSHGEKETQPVKTLKKKNSKPELQRPSTSYGEDFSRRPSTSHGEKVSKLPVSRGPKSPNTEQQSREIKRKSELPRPSTSNGQPASAQERTTEKKSGLEMQRPSTSHGEKVSQLPVSSRGEKTSRGRGREPPMVELPASASREARAIASKNARTITLDRVRQEKPPPLAEGPRARTVSFYEEHMDSPSMPPPLSLGPKNPASSSLNRMSLASPVTRKPVPSPLGLAKPLSSSSGPKTAKSSLPSDGGAFLDRPFIEKPVPKKGLRKRPSLTSLFRRNDSTENVDVVPEPVVTPTTPKPLKPILKTSKSMPVVRDLAPVLKSKRSFGESLRAKFNTKTESQPAPVPAPVLVTRLEEVDSEEDNEIEFDDEDWKPSYLIRDDKEPRTPRELDAPNFTGYPTYEPGTVSLPWRVIRNKKHAERVAKRGGKYGQGEDFSRLVERPPDSLYDDLKKQAAVKPYKKPLSPSRVAAKALLHDILVKQGLRKEESVEEEEYPDVPMEPLVRTTTEERLGPLLEEIRTIVKGTMLDEKPAFVVAEGTGDEDQPSPSPSDFGDEKSKLLEKFLANPSLLRSTKSMGDLKTTSESGANAENQARKLVKQEKVKKEKAKKSSGITTADISSPVLISLPEWEEEILNTLSKDHTRKFLLEKAKTDKYDYLDPPQGPPIDKKIPKRKLGAMKKFEKLAVVTEESERLSWALLGSAPAGNTTLPAILQGREKDVGSVYGSLLGAESVLSVFSSVKDTASVVTMPRSVTGEEEENERPKTPKKVRILSQATMQFGREFEQPRATPKPPQRPYRPQPEDSIFPPRPPPKTEKKKQVESPKEQDTRYSAFFG